MNLLPSVIYHWLLRDWMKMYLQNLNTPNNWMNILPLHNNLVNKYKIKALPKQQQYNYISRFTFKQAISCLHVVFALTDPFLLSPLPSPFFLPVEWSRNCRKPSHQWLFVTSLMYSGVHPAVSPISADTTAVSSHSPLHETGKQICTHFSKDMLKKMWHELLLLLSLARSEENRTNKYYS